MDGRRQQRRNAAGKPGSEGRLTGPSKIVRALPLWIAALAIQTAGVGIAQDVHPIIPPVACCGPQCCPSSIAACVPVPCVPIAESYISVDPNAQPVQLLTVHEAIRTALSNSEVVRNLGLVDAQSDIDIIRGTITTYDPRAAYAAAAGEWGIFDPLWTTEMQWDRIDIPPGTSFSGIGNRPPELDTADFYTSIEQLLPLGSRVHVDYATDYLFNPNHPPGLDPNPQYFSYVQFGLTQPLMQGLGVPVTMAPIRIACAEAERTDWQFKQEVLALVRSVETAYWTLYSEQQNLRALDEALPLFREIVRVREQQARGAAGTESEVARAVSEMLLYEQRRLDTLSRIAEQQLVLRNLMGLPVDAGLSFKLVALPVTTPPLQTVGDAVMTAINQRPDVLRQRIAVYVAQQERILARDSLRPKFDFNAFWRINGLGEDLGESLDVIGQNDFHDWHLGFQLQVPLGRRQGRANVRAAELIIQKERALLDQAAHQASYEVADAYRRIMWLYQQHQVSASRVRALTTWREGARAQFENPPPGVSTVLALELYLNNLRDFVEASIKSHAILADFNSALARLEEVKGTLLETRLIEVAGDQTDAVPEELPTPTLQELPDWLVPAPAAVPEASSGSGSTIPRASPAAAAPPTTGSALVTPDVAAVPLTVPAAPANSQPPALIPAPPAYDGRTPPVAAKPLTSDPTTKLPSVSGSNDRTPEERAPSAAPVLEQSPHPLALGDAYGPNDQTPDRAEAPTPQNTHVERGERHAQVPPTLPMREPLLSPPDAMRLTLPSQESKQAPSSSRLVMRSEPEVEDVPTAREPSRQWQRPDTKSISNATVPSARRETRASAAPQSNGNITPRPNIAQQPAAPPKQQALQLPDLYENAAPPVDPPAAPTFAHRGLPPAAETPNLRQPAYPLGSSEAWATTLHGRAQQRSATKPLQNPENAYVGDSTDLQPSPNGPSSDAVSASEPAATALRNAERPRALDAYNVPQPPLPPIDAVPRLKVLLDPRGEHIFGLQRIAVEPRLAQTPTFVNPELQYVEQPTHHHPAQDNPPRSSDAPVPQADRRLTTQPCWSAPGIVNPEASRLDSTAPGEAKRPLNNRLAHPAWIRTPVTTHSKPTAARLANPAGFTGPQSGP